MSNDYIAHHGVKGQKWGVRRYRNKDGSLTPAGKKKYEQYKSLQSDSGHIQKIESINADHFKRSEAINDSFNRKDKELFERMVGSKKLSGADYDSAYGKYNKESLKLYRQRKRALANGKATFEDLKDRYRDVYVEELGLKDIKDGKELVKKFEMMQFYEEYERRPL